MNQPLRNHGHHQIPLLTARRANQFIYPKLLDRSEDGFHMPMGNRSLNNKGVASRYQRLIPQNMSKSFHFLERPLGEVGNGPFTNSLALSPGFPEQNRRRRVAIRDSCDIHGNMYIIYL